MKHWFRVVEKDGGHAFVKVEREGIRDVLARLIKPIELKKIPEAELNDDTRFEAYCRALAEADQLIDAAEEAGQMNVGAFKFRFVAL
jgi:hypothetical protein